MNKKGFVASFLVLALALVSCGGDASDNDLKDLGLRGSVKSVSEKKFHAVLGEDGSIEKGTFFRGEGEWDYTEVFDKRGKYLSIAFLDRDGDTVAMNRYEYGENGLLAFKRFYEGGSTLKMSSQYEYDLLGRVTLLYELDEDNYMLRASNTEYNDENLIETCTTINNKGTMVGQTVVQKNRRGDVTDFKYYNEERVLANWRKETHDEEGKLIEMSVLNPDESLYFKLKCAYNLHGDLVSSVPSSEEDEFFSESYTYEYDKKSNWVKKIQFRGDSAVSVIERVIDYY